MHFRIFLTVIAHGKATYGIVVNSFNGLTVGSGQLNGIGNDVYVADVFNDPQNFRSAPRSSPSRPPASASSVIINSFRGNIVGQNSLQNNAGISLVPRRVASTSNLSRVSLFVILFFFVVWCFVVWLNWIQPFCWI